MDGGLIIHPFQAVFQVPVMPGALKPSVPPPAVARKIGADILEITSGVKSFR
jgi:hypothetical protein